MKCRSCAAEIADKAIVCYRCGTPTAEPAAPSTPRRAARPRWLVVPVLVVIVVLAVWLVPETPADSFARAAAWVGVVLVAAAAVWFVRRR